MAFPVAAEGASGPLQARFEDGLRFLAAASALRLDARASATALTSACDALQCFLAIFDAAAQRHLPDPAGDMLRLRDQCIALLTPHQAAEDALAHALEAAKLARDEAARLLPGLLAEPWTP